MPKFVISTDSTADLYSNEVKDLNLYFLPLTFTLNNKGVITEYKDVFTCEQEYIDYYNKLRSGLIGKTSMNNPYVHEEYFTEMAKSGVKDALHFTISYGLCRTVDVAREAVENVRIAYPDFNCLCIECGTTTVGQGMLVKIASKMRDEGKTLKETYDYIESIKNNIQHFIIADDLMYLMRGGRISATKATVGKLLNVKPIIIFNKEGKLVNFKKEKGLKRAIISIADEFTKYTVNDVYNKIIICHTDNREGAEILEKILKEKYNVQTEIRIIGPVIGSHLGPGTVAYCFLSNEERPM